MKAIIQKSIYRNFFNLLYRKAQWDNPTYETVKLVKYFLKTGEIISFTKTKHFNNFFWKFPNAKPLKYWFRKLRSKSEKLKEKYLESLSKKWTIEERQVRDN